MMSDSRISAVSLIPLGWGGLGRRKSPGNLPAVYDFFRATNEGQQVCHPRVTPAWPFLFCYLGTRIPFARINSAGGGKDGGLASADCP